MKTKKTLMLITLLLFVSSFAALSAQNVPVIYRISEGIRPNSLISIYGAYLTGKHPVVKFISNDGSLVDSVSVVQADSTGLGRFCRVIFPSIAPGAYKLVISNDSGWSTKPMYINLANPRWVWLERMYPGMKNKLLGRNLDALEYNGVRNTKIQLVPKSGGSPIDATVDKITPYCVDFTVPFDAPNGTYYIEVRTNSAGFGQEWKRLDNESEMPVTIISTEVTIEDAPSDPTALETGVAWAKEFDWNYVVNVKDYGAKGDSVTDDAAAIQKAYDQVEKHLGGVVYIPDGKYFVKGPLASPAHCILKGESKEGTILYFNQSADQKKRGSINFKTGSKTIGYQGICNLSIVARREPILTSNYCLVNFWATISSKYFFFYNISIDAGFPLDPVNEIGGLPYTLNGVGAHSLLKNCQFKGMALSQMKSMSLNTSIIGCSAWTTGSLGWEVSGDKTLMVDNYFYNHNDMYNNTTTQLNGFFLGGNGNGTLETNLYFANNTSDQRGHGDCQPWSLDSQEQNCAGKVKSTTDNKVTMQEDYKMSQNWNQDWLVFVVSGKGMGQIRRYVRGSNVKTAGTPIINEFQVSPPWDVQPDNTSMIIVRRESFGYVLESNVSVNGRAAGLFRAQSDNVIANDAGLNTSGVYVMGTNTLWANPNGFSPEYFIQVKRSNYSGIPLAYEDYYGGLGARSVGERAESETTPTGNFPANYGNEWRDNYIENTGPASGLVHVTGSNGIGMWGNRPNNLTASLAEGNTFQGADYGVGLGNTSSVAIRGNTLINTPIPYIEAGVYGHKFYTYYSNQKPDDLMYPVPTPFILGYNKAGSSNLVCNANEISATQFHTFPGYTATQMKIFLNSAVSGKMKLAIFSDKNNAPDSLLSGTNEITNPVAGWNTFNLLVPQTITADKNYWLCAWSDASYIVKSELAEGTNGLKSVAYGEWPSSLTSADGSTTNKLSIYATTKPLANVQIENVVQAYDGSPKPVTTLTYPNGLNVAVTYNGSSVVPSCVGKYSVLATINDNVYQGVFPGQLTITRVTKLDCPSVNTGVSESYSNSIKVYPNPIKSNSQLTIYFGETTYGTVELSNLEGRVLLNQNIEGRNILDLDAKALSKGIYIVTIKTSKGPVSKKIVVM
jgi:hypothetical protein